MGRPHTFTAATPTPVANYTWTSTGASLAFSGPPNQQQVTVVASAAGNAVDDVTLSVQADGDTASITLTLVEVQSITISFRPTPPTNVNTAVAAEQTYRLNANLPRRNDRRMPPFVSTQTQEVFPPSFDSTVLMLLRGAFTVAANVDMPPPPRPCCGRWCGTATMRPHSAEPCRA